MVDEEPLWLTARDLALIHAEQLRRFGGLVGYKDEGLIESCATAPRQLYHYDSVDDALSLAIRLCFAIVRNHPFIDGNKRTATAAMIEFLAINSYHLLVPDDDEELPTLGLWIERLTAKAYDERHLYDRLKYFVEPIV